METKEIIKELELNYGYKFNEHERNEYSFITDLISDVQKLVSKNESLHLVSKPLVIATETTKNIVKGKKYELIEQEYKGCFIIDETGEESYYSLCFINVC